MIYEAEHVGCYVSESVTRILFRSLSYDVHCQLQAFEWDQQPVQDHLNNQGRDQLQFLLLLDNLAIMPGIMILCMNVIRYPNLRRISRIRNILGHRHR